MPISTQWLWQGAGVALDFGFRLGDSVPSVTGLTGAVAHGRRSFTATVADYSVGTDRHFVALAGTALLALTSPDSGFAVFQAGLGYLDAAGRRQLHIPVGIGTSDVFCLFEHQRTRSWWVWASPRLDFLYRWGPQGPGVVDARLGGSIGLNMTLRNGLGFQLALDGLVERHYPGLGSLGVHYAFRHLAGAAPTGGISC